MEDPTDKLMTKEEAEAFTEMISAAMPNEDDLRGYINDAMGYVSGGINLILDEMANCLEDELDISEFEKDPDRLRKWHMQKALGRHIAYRIRRFQSSIAPTVEAYEKLDRGE